MVKHAMKAYRRNGVKLYAFLTSALDGTEWSASLCLFTPWKQPPVPIEEETGGAKISFCMFQRRENILPLLGSRPHVPQTEAQAQYTDYSIPAPKKPINLQ